jgi:hypothetical protein
MRLRTSPAAEFQSLQTRAIMAAVLWSRAMGTNRCSNLRSKPAARTRSGFSWLPSAIQSSVIGNTARAPILRGGWRSIRAS